MARDIELKPLQTLFGNDLNQLPLIHHPEGIARGIFEEKRNLLTSEIEREIETKSNNTYEIFCLN
jgi:hypothetical protein